MVRVEASEQIREGKRRERRYNTGIAKPRCIYEGRGKTAGGKAFVLVRLPEDLPLRTLGIESSDNP